MGNGFDGSAIAKYCSNIGNPINDLVTAVILAVVIAVAAVPEGLPMMIAMVLSLNMKKRLKDNVLVRKLVGIETAVFLEKSNNAAVQKQDTSSIASNFSLTTSLCKYSYMSWASP